MKGLSGIIMAVALAVAPLTASAAVIAATSAATMVAASAASSSVVDNQMPQGVSASPIEWAAVGWLDCPVRFSEPSGCRKTIDAGWRGDEPGDIEPWVDWMKRHKGPSARFMGMAVVKGHVRLFYGIPAEGAK